MPRFPAAGCVAAVLLAVVAAQAQAQGNSTVYRCPGPPVLYTDSINATEAKEKGCRLLEGVPITVIQSPRPRSQPVPPVERGAAPDQRVDPSAQRARDSDARRILEGELRREEEQLAALKREYNNGEPERRGDERNYQKYIDRVAEMKAQIARREADIAAIRREIGKLPAP